MLHVELNKLAPQQVKEINELRKMGVPDDIIQMGIDNENRKLQESLSDEELLHKFDEEGMGGQ